MFMLLFFPERFLFKGEFCFRRVGSKPVLSFVSPNMEHSPDVNKENEEFIQPDSTCAQNKDIDIHSVEPIEAKCLPRDVEMELERQVLDNNELDVGHDSVLSSTTLKVSIEVNETIQSTENGPPLLSENGSAVQDTSSPGNHKRIGSPISSHEIDDESALKRSRITVDEQQASVHVTYNSLTRESKQKLEELLQKWSEWHARHHSSHVSKQELESGEGTYFPAFNIGAEKRPAVSFWIDGQTRSSVTKEFIQLDNHSIPLYDRGCSFGLTSTDGPSNIDGGLEIVDASRCFNCGSYNHALKECPKPRDNAAVNNARKQHKTRRNQNAMSRNPTRYYQDTPGGRYDGLRPGALDAETRKLLGLGELDPPPWLNRMRELGYPPGYLDPEDEDEPSGIQIYGNEEEVKQETEDGEILDTECPPEPPRTEPRKKKSVEFPGVNAPIPENADEWRWGARAWNFDLPRNRSHHRSYSSRETTSKPRHHEQRWTRDYRDDGPPGVDPGSSPLNSTFSPRYSDYDFRSPKHGRSPERSKRSPLRSSSKYHESSSSRDDDRWNPYPEDSSSHHKDRNEDQERRHHSRR